MPNSHVVVGWNYTCDDLSSVAYNILQSTDTSNLLNEAYQKLEIEEKAQKQAFHQETNVSVQTSSEQNVRKEERSFMQQQEQQHVMQSHVLVQQQQQQHVQHFQSNMQQSSIGYGDAAMLQQDSAPSTDIFKVVHFLRFCVAFPYLQFWFYRMKLQWKRVVLQLCMGTRLLVEKSEIWTSNFYCVVTLHGGDFNRFRQKTGYFRAWCNLLL